MSCGRSYAARAFEEDPLALPLSRSRMTPSRSPPLPICSGCPSSSRELLQDQHARRAAASRAAGRARSASPHRRSRRSRAPARRAPGSRTPAPRPPASAARSRCRRPRRPGRDARAPRPRRVRDRVAQRADLRRRGRVALQVLLGQRARPDLPGADLGRPPRRACPKITSEEPPPTSTTATVPSTGWPSDLVAPRKASRPSSSSLSTSTSTPGLLLDRLHDLVAVLGLADRGGGDDLDHLGAQLARRGAPGWSRPRRPRRSSRR